MVVPPKRPKHQKWSFLVGTPMVVGETHHFRKPPYDDSRVFMNLFFFQLAFFWRVRLQPSPYLTQPVIFTTGPWRKSSPYFLLLEPPETSIFWCFLVDFQSSNSRKNTNTFNFKSFFLQSLKLLNSWEFLVSESISLNRGAPFKEKMATSRWRKRSERVRLSWIRMTNGEGEGPFYRGGKWGGHRKFLRSMMQLVKQSHLCRWRQEDVFGIWWKTFTVTHLCNILIMYSYFL